MIHTFIHLFINRGDERCHSREFWVLSTHHGPYCAKKSGHGACEHLTKRVAGIISGENSTSYLNGPAFMSVHTSTSLHCPLHLQRVLCVAEDTDIILTDYACYVCKDWSFSLAAVTFAHQVCMCSWIMCRYDMCAHTCVRASVCIWTCIVCMLPTAHPSSLKMSDDESSLRATWSYLGLLAVQSPYLWSGSK